MSNDTRRRNYGRNHGYILDGHKCEGVTTLIKGGVPSPAIPYWAARTVATEAIENAAAYAAMKPQVAIAALKEAPWADRDEAARRGTEVHGLAEQIQSGAEVDVPEPLVGHVDAYLDWRATFGPSDEIIEGVVVNRARRYMGTFDGIATVTEGEHRRVLYDIKTTRSGVYAETVLQLAAYRHAEKYLPDPSGGDELGMPAVDGCAVLWLRADGWDWFPVDADEAAFRVFLHAAEVARGMSAGKGEKSFIESRIGAAWQPEGTDHAS